MATIQTKLIWLPFLQDSEVIITSAPNCRQQSAILSSSVATTRTRENYQEASKMCTCIHLPNCKTATRFFWIWSTRQSA